jgi:nucleotide-binding universal stress UspA family protein
MLPIHTILHPTDFSAHSANAFHLACSLARDHGARLIVLHVRQPMPVYYGEGLAFVPEEPPAVEEGLRKQLTALRPSDAAIPVEHCLVTGEAAAEILRFARERGCDLIVMGTHGRTGLGRLLLGSVSEAVLRRSLCPVLTVKGALSTAAAAAEALETANA